MGHKRFGRRTFIRNAAAGLSSVYIGSRCAPAHVSHKKPNILYIFADQWRAQSIGYEDDPNAVTPHIDSLAGESINFTNAVSGCPVCSPYRASLMTGRYPLSTGIFINDVPLAPDSITIGKVLRDAGYDTGYIGKWHIDAHGRDCFIPPERRQGFTYWRTQECTHAYNNSFYYGDENRKLKWDGYDAEAQTHETQHYLRTHDKKKPFALFLSWGPPHDPYQTAPQRYRERYDKNDIILRPNVPEEFHEKSRTDLAGYYAHVAALDDCVGSLVQTLKECDLDKNTIFVFTSDHGDMLGSQGHFRKQKPWDESVRVPFLVRCPDMHGSSGRTVETPFNTPDIMPTLLGLCDIGIPETVEGDDFSTAVHGSGQPRKNAAILSCPWPFAKYGLAEFRGIRTQNHTYVRRHEGPWLLYDNRKDPYQLENLSGKPDHREMQNKLDSLLAQRLNETNDEFLPGIEYIKKWGYTVDESGAAPYNGDITKY